VHGVIAAAVDTTAVAASDEVYRRILTRTYDPRAEKFGGGEEADR